LTWANICSQIASKTRLDLNVPKNFGTQLKLNKNTELAQGVDVMMAWVKRIYILIIKVDKLFFFFITVFPKRNRKHVLHVSIEL